MTPDELRAEAQRLDEAAHLAERLATADTIPACPDCGGRDFNIGAWTIVTQSISFEEADDANDGEWGDDYESGDHTETSFDATCNHCERDCEDVLRRFGWMFYLTTDKPAKVSA